MKLFLFALQFLTIFPIKIKSPIKESDFGKSLIFFPVVGAIIGLLLVLILLLFGFLPNLIKSSLILMVSIIITGAIHLDGFADTCDGLYGFKTKERALEIMRDSRIGTMAVIAITLLLLLKFTLLVNIAQGNLWKVLFLMPTFARWSQVLACFSSDYVREEGKAKYFVEYVTGKEFFIGTLVTLALFILLMKVKGLILFISTIVPIFLCINYVKKRLGGMTGDTIGAVNEIAETLLPLTALILPG